MPSLYERVGGQPVIATLITSFYKKVFTDPILGPFFTHTSLEKLTQMQEQFFSIALGGPEPENEISLQKAHQGRNIEERHLNRFIEHLMSTLQEVGVEETEAQEIVERISEYSHDILEQKPESGGK
jgi:hemoglobin